MALPCRSPSLPAEVLVQVVEHGGPALEPGLVIAMPHGDTRDQSVDASRLGTIKLRVLQIDVVHDLRNRHEGAIVETQPRHENLEGAEVALVRELGLEHVESELAALGTVSFSGHELEPRVRVDDAPDQPGARDPIDVNALPGDPRAATKIFDPLTGSCSDSSPTHPRLEAGEQTLRCLPTRRAEEVDGDHFREAPVQPGDLCLDLSAPVFRNLGTARDGISNSASFLRDLPVVRVTRGVEQRLDLVVPKPVDEGSFAQRRIAAFPDDLAQDPFEVLASLVASRQHVDRVLDRDRPEGLEPSPDLHPEVRGLRRDLVDQQEPGAVAVVNRHALNQPNLECNYCIRRPGPAARPAW